MAQYQNRIAEYRKEAQAALERAEKASLDRTKADFLRIAQEWEKMARELEQRKD